MTKLDDLKKDWLKKLDVQVEYQTLEEEFSIAEALIQTQRSAKITKEQFVEKI